MCSFKSLRVQPCSCQTILLYSSHTCKYFKISQHSSFLFFFFFFETHLSLSLSLSQVPNHFSFLLLHNQSFFPFNFVSFFLHPNLHGECIQSFSFSIFFLSSSNPSSCPYHLATGFWVWWLWWWCWLILGVSFVDWWLWWWLVLGVGLVDWQLILGVGLVDWWLW